jgi:hypothetical protein
VHQNSHKAENVVKKNETIQRVIKAILAIQRRAWEQGVAALALLELGETEIVILFAKDAVVNDILDDPTTFVKTNRAQMLAYSIFRGVKGGWLDKSYLNYANKMPEAAHQKVDQFGLVQGVCGAPNFDRAGTATEGQAFFLLMDSAYNDMIPY